MNHCCLFAYHYYSWILEALSFTHRVSEDVTQDLLTWHHGWWQRSKRLPSSDSTRDLCNLSRCHAQTIAQTLSHAYGDMVTTFGSAENKVDCAQILKRGLLLSSPNINSWVADKTSAWVDWHFRPKQSPRLLNQKLDWVNNVLHSSCHCQDMRTWPFYRGLRLLAAVSAQSISISGTQSLECSLPWCKCR